MLTKAVSIPSMSTNNKIYTFPVFNAPSSTNTCLNDCHISEKDSVKLKLAIKNAEAIIPTPREINTLLVTSTIMIAKIGGTSDHIVLSITKTSLELINFKKTFYYPRIQILSLNTDYFDYLT